MQNISLVMKRRPEEKYNFSKTRQFPLEMQTSLTYIPTPHLWQSPKKAKEHRTTKDA